MADPLDEGQRSRRVPLWIGPKMLAGAAAGLLVSLGLCGLSAQLYRNQGLTRLDTLSVGIALLSGVVLVVGAIVFVVELIVNARRGK